MNRNIHYSLLLLLAVILLGGMGCRRPENDAKTLNSNVPVPGTWYSPAPTFETTYDDTSTSAATSPHLPHAHKEVEKRVEPALKSMSPGSLSELYTTTIPGTATPRLRFTAQIDKKLLPKQREQRARQLAAAFETTLDKIEKEPSVKDATPLLEDLYFVMDRLGKLPNASNAVRKCKVVSDMEPYSQGILTTSEIITANDEQMKALISRMQAKFPPLQLPPHEVVIIYLPTQMNARVLPPSSVKKLLGFWEATFKAWGVGKLTIVEPRSYSPIPIDDTQSSAASTKSGPFEERPGTSESPSLTVENGYNPEDRLTFTDRQGKSYTMDLPLHKRAVLFLPAGAYTGRLEHAGDGVTIWTGRARFKPYKRYSTRYVEGGGGTPLYFGEPD